VGPDYYDYDTDAEADALLASAYKAAMAHAQRLGVRTLAFSLLSAAIYRAHRPLAVVLRIAVDALRNAAYDGLEEVHLVGFTSQEVRTLLEAARDAARDAVQGAAPDAPQDAAPAAEADATAAD
jgi:O-acetyl-ADP-ribose deacetylase (regulator of RNase III)